MNCRTVCYGKLVAIASFSFSLIVFSHPISAEAQSWSVTEIDQTTVSPPGSGQSNPCIVCVLAKGDGGDCTQECTTDQGNSG